MAFFGTKKVECNIIRGVKMGGSDWFGKWTKQVRVETGHFSMERNGSSRVGLTC